MQPKVVVLHPTMKRFIEETEELASRGCSPEARSEDQHRRGTRTASPPVQPRPQAGPPPAPPPVLTPAPTAPPAQANVPAPPPPPAEPPSGGGNGSGGFERWASENPTIAILLGVLVTIIALIALIGGLGWFNNYFMQHQVAMLKDISTLPQAGARSEEVSSTLPVSPITQAPPSGKQEMIGRCGRHTSETRYNADPGCFYFDNNAGQKEVTVQLWSRGRFHSIINDDDRNKGITITASDGATCTSGESESCSHFVQEHSVPDSDGFRKFTIHVPQGQGFIANILS